MRVLNLADRPDLAGAALAMPTSWPEFMLNDPVAIRLLLTEQAYPALQLVAVDDGDQVIGLVRAVGFRFGGDPADLPGGWDQVLERGIADASAGREPTAGSLLEAAIHPEHQGRGLSLELLRAARAAAADAGLRDLFGPVRPGGKAAEPWLPIAEYVARRRPDDLPADSWLRVHARLGAELVGICPVSMTIPGTLDQWRSWTGLPLDRSGPQPVPGGIVPLHVSVEQQHAVYVEPNVWMRHRLS